MTIDGPTPLKRSRLWVRVGLLALALMGVMAWTVYHANQQGARNVALWEAVNRGDRSTVLSLLDRGADPNTNEYEILDFQYRRGMAALMARVRGRELRYNQDPETGQWTSDPRVAGNWTQRQKWNTVLWLATDRDYPDIARALIAKGATDQATGYLDTALMWAAARGYRDIVQSLLAGGSDVNARNDFGDTALDGAATQGDIEIARLLLQNGAQISRSNALAHARAGGHEAMVELIEKTRANQGDPAHGLP